MTNPILKAHLEGKDELDKVLSPQYGILVMLLKRFYPDGNIADEMAYDLFLEIKANTKSFLTTYAINILKAAKEAGPGEKIDKRKKQLIKKFGGWWERKCLKCGFTDFDSKIGQEEHGLQAGYGAGPNGETVHYIRRFEKTPNDCRGLVEEIWHEGTKCSCLSSYRAAIDEGIKEISN